VPQSKHRGVPRIDTGMAALPIKKLPCPGGGGIKLWLAGPARAHAVPDNLWDLLSSTEKDRADRFARPSDRALFVAARGVLRCLLSEATGIAGGKIRLAEGPSGKPHLSGIRGPHFNISHSGLFALIGLAENRPVGVDIERMLRTGDELNVAGDYFSADEYHALQDLKQEAMLSGFYQIWTCKEAILKAWGAGISGQAKSFTVELKKDRFAFHRNPHCALSSLASVCAWPVAVPEGYAACCALA